MKLPTLDFGKPFGHSLGYGGFGESDTYDETTAATAERLCPLASEYRKAGHKKAAASAFSEASTQKEFVRIFSMTYWVTFGNFHRGLITCH